jgi:hypothetical protein
MSLIEKANGYMNSPDIYFEWEKMKLVHDLKSKVEEMQKTLEWYADEKNWKLGVNISMGSAFPLHEAIKSDKGERARQALKGESQ